MDPHERARKNETLLLQRLAAVGQASAAACIGVDDSTVSRMKEKDFQRFSMLLAHLELKVVPVEMKCYPQDYINHIFGLAKIGMNRMNSADDLAWED